MVTAVLNSLLLWVQILLTLVIGPDTQTPINSVAMKATNSVYSVRSWPSSLRHSFFQCGMLPPVIRSPQDYRMGSPEVTPISDNTQAIT
jgi:hypothetical protein